MKFSKVLALYLATFVVLIGLGFYVLWEIKSEIYFNIWLNQTIQKGQSGSLLVKRDMEYGLPVVTDYEISGKKIGLEEIFPIVTYDKKVKMIDISLMLPGFEHLGFNNLPKDLSKKICSDVNVAVYRSSLIVNGEEFDGIKDFVKFTRCNFLAEDEETYVLVSTGGWVFKRDSKEPSEFTVE
ncbi:MAG: hypothetical protein EBS06_08825 [Proteobacteria bacterium]|nr:hypothetical protein [Pseudomonadota bacterium]